MSHIFFSYSHKNMQEAELLQNLFTKNGLEVWVDNNGIRAGSEFAEEIYNAIEQSCCLVLLLTEESDQSTNVLKEVHKADSINKPIIPIKITKFNRSQNTGYYIDRLHITTLDRIDEADKQMQKLLSDLKSYQNGITPARAAAPVRSASTAADAATAATNASRTLAAVIAVICGAVLLLAVLFLWIIPGLFGNLFDNFKVPSMPDLPGISDTKDDDEETLPIPDPNAINQIPEEFADKVALLKATDNPLELGLYTRKVKVGGMVSLNPHDTNIVIYSEDTSIAVAEGLLVKGVSPGTVYVVSVDKDWHHTTAAYLIIVE